MAIYTVTNDNNSGEGSLDTTSFINALLSEDIVNTGTNINLTSAIGNIDDLNLISLMDTTIVQSRDRISQIDDNDTVDSTIDIQNFNFRSFPVATAETILSYNKASDLKLVNTQVEENVVDDVDTKNSTTITTTPNILLVTNSNDSGTGSLREAIALANANQGADIIRLMVDVNLNSSIDITDSVKIRSAFGATINQTGRDRIFNIDDGNDKVDSQVSLAKLNLTGGSPVSTGGAILSYEALTVTDSAFIGNETTLRGGAIYQESGSLRVVNSEFRNNTIATGSTSAGGAIYVKGAEATVLNSILADNSAGGGGGLTGVYGAEIKINGSTISDNTGSGIVIIEGDLALSNSTVSGNNASISGGGIVIEQNSTGTITNTTIEKNFAPYGGGIEVLINSNLTILNSTISGNRASISGGGIDIYENSTLEVRDSVITGNSSETGGGIASYDNTSDIKLINTQVTGNVVQDIYGDVQIITTEDLIEIKGNPQDNVLNGNDNNNTIKAFGGDDLIYGNGGDDLIQAGKGDDTIYGGVGDDKLVGGKGDDILYGGVGKNILKGGQGSDVFAIGEGLSVIKDFELGTDRIGLADGVSYDDLDIIKGANSHIFLDGDRIAIVRNTNVTQDSFMIEY